MTTIYIVTSGCYSDYHIVCPFSTRERAEGFVKYWEHVYFDGFQIEEFTLDRWEPTHADRLRIELDYDLNITGIYRGPWFRWGEVSEPPPEGVTEVYHYKNPTIFCVNMFSTLPDEAAAKIACEHAARYKVEKGL